MFERAELGSNRHLLSNSFNSSKSKNSLKLLFFTTKCHMGGRGGVRKAHPKVSRIIWMAPDTAVPINVYWFKVVKMTQKYLFRNLQRLSIYWVLYVGAIVGVALTALLFNSLKCCCCCCWCICPVILEFWLCPWPAFHFPRTNNNKVKKSGLIIS